MAIPNKWSYVSLPILLVLTAVVGITCGKKDQQNSFPGGSSTSGTPGSGSGDAANYPLVTPPVKQATPNAFKSGDTRSLMRRLSVLDTNVADTLDANAFISRFFSAGPTELFNVLGGIDNLITGINMQSGFNDQNCLAQAPVAYTLVVPGGNVQMVAQCYEEVSPEYQGDPGFVQWGQANGAFYIYSAVGVGWTAAVVTPLANNSNTTLDGNAAANANVTLDVNDYIIHAWYSVGLNNFTVTYQGMDGLGWFNGSYCIAEIYADPNSNRFEMTAAGGGIGFCGAQFVSDGNDVFGVGSTDMGSTCNAASTVCLDANTGLAQTSCSVDQNSFVLTPLGRQSAVLSPNATWAASQYPGDGNNLVVLNGTTSDSAHFGPGAPATGAGLFAPLTGGSTTGGNANVAINANASTNTNDTM